MVLVNTFSYSSYIDAAGKNGRFDEAKQAFDAAVEKELADTITYSSYIDAAGKNGRFDEAKGAFDAAVAKELADTITYSSYIDAAGKNGRFDEAQTAFNQAVNLKSACNKLTYHIFIDVLVSYSKFNEAVSLFQKANLPIVLLGNNQRLIDLHGYSHGSGIVALYLHLNQLPAGARLEVITGKGCLEDGNYLSFRNNIQSYLSKHLRITSSFDSQNEGKLLVVNRKD